MYYQILALVVLSDFGFSTIWYYLVLSVFLHWYYLVFCGTYKFWYWYYLALYGTFRFWYGHYLVFSGTF